MAFYLAIYYHSYYRTVVIIIQMSDITKEIFIIYIIYLPYNKQIVLPKTLSSPWLMAQAVISSLRLHRMHL